jgi:hypothetical protein
MEKKNIIISFVIVLCIAAGVTAYELINPDNSIFTSLTGFTPEDPATGGDGQGPGNNGSGGNGAGNGGSGLNNGGGSKISSSDARNIANNHIEMDGYSAGTPRVLNNGNWYVPVVDSHGNIVDGFEIDSRNGKMIGKA